MIKESIYELQLIDCNCNDCKFLVRNNYKKQLSDQLHERWQREEFDRNRNDALFQAYVYKDTIALNIEIKKTLKVKKPLLTYGYCKKFDFKEVSFIPNTCQLETQDCFVHRKQQTPGEGGMPPPVTSG